MLRAGELPMGNACQRVLAPGLGQAARGGAGGLPACFAGGLWHHRHAHHVPEPGNLSGCYWKTHVGTHTSTGIVIWLVCSVTDPMLLTVTKRWLYTLINIFLGRKE